MWSSFSFTASASRARTADEQRTLMPPSARRVVRLSSALHDGDRSARCSCLWALAPRERSLATANFYSCFTEAFSLPVVIWPDGEARLVAEVCSGQCVTIEVEDHTDGATG